MKRPRVLSWAIFCLCVVGIVLSSVSLKTHYSSATTEFCSFDETFNCDLVNRSIYSKFLGMPVALIGLLGYVWMLALARFAPWNRTVAALLLVSALVGLGFSLYLTYLEAYVLGVWCILCLGSLAAIVAITVLSGAALTLTFRVREPGEAAAS